MSDAGVVAVERGFGRTARRDAWWIQPLAVFIGLGTFVAYSTWAALQGEFYTYGPYLSPMYSPELWGSSPHALFGEVPPWWPGFLPYSPAILILWAPAGFRLTCYYYRGAYYKAFWSDPPACAVGEPRSAYRGENSFPLIIQNVHRYLLPFAMMLIAFLSYDAWGSYWFTDPASGDKVFGIGLGSLILTLNVVLLGGYTFGCHSFRHLVGGGRDRLSGRPLMRNCYNCVSAFNRRHMLWAWMSLVVVGFSDVYVRMCAMGIWQDLRIL